MGQGGNISLVNCTPYDWAITIPEQPYKMNAWPFKPTTIRSMTSMPTRIEWCGAVFQKTSDQTGNITISLVGTNHSFKLQARQIHGDYTLQVYLENIATAEHPRGGMVDVGFEHNGEVHFIMSGSKDGLFSIINLRAGNFNWGSIPEAWMEGNIDTLGHLPLHQICMPGTHDSGMSEQKTVHGTAVAVNDTCVCQSVSILGQLSAGSRYFDIRPVLASGIFRTGHYSNLGDILRYQGMNGQEISEIIEEINNFTASNNELLILNLSHALQTDLDYISFTPQNWADLFEKLHHIKDLYVRPASVTAALADLNLSEFIGNNKAAVVILVPNDVNIPASYANHGFYPLSELRVKDEYSNTNDAERMINEQVKLMYDTNASIFFVLSWTLTQSPLDAISSTLLPTPIDSLMSCTVKQLAQQVNPRLYTQLLSRCTKGKYPNVIYIDYMKGSNRDVAALAMAINNLYAH